MLAGEAVAESNDGGIAFFEKAIRPVLVKHCYECHSAESAARGKLQAGLSLDTRQGTLTGGNLRSVAGTNSSLNETSN